MNKYSEYNDRIAKHYDERTIRMLFRFLKSKGIYFSYMKYMTLIEYDLDSIYYISVFKNTINNKEFIRCGFLWASTLEGNDFWKKIAKSWDFFIKCQERYEHIY